MCNVDHVGIALSAATRRNPRSVFGGCQGGILRVAEREQKHVTLTLRSELTRSFVRSTRRPSLYFVQLPLKVCRLIINLIKGHDALRAQTQTSQRDLNMHCGRSYRTFLPAAVGQADSLVDSFRGYKVALECDERGVKYVGSVEPFVSGRIGIYWAQALTYKLWRDRSRDRYRRYATRERRRERSGVQV